MIESGTHAPGVSAQDFGLRPLTALRYEQAHPDLCRFLPGYAVMDSDAAFHSDTPALGLPGWGLIWIVFADQPIAAQIGNRRYAPLGSAMLCGVTSRAMAIKANGGVSVAIEVSPLGWARLFRTPAEELRDRFTPLEELLPRESIEELIAELAASDLGRDVKPICDAFWLRHLPPPQPDEGAVARIAGLIADPAVGNLTDAAADIGIDARALRRVSRRYFGFPPKLLLIRARFLRALVPMLLGEADRAELPHPYHDWSHFNRDAKRLLGMTARRFLLVPNDYVRAVLRARRLVTGSATPALDGAPRILPTQGIDRAA